MATTRRPIHTIRGVTRTTIWAKIEARLESRGKGPTTWYSNDVDGGWAGRISSRPSLAGVAQLVEHHLAKVDVESSSLFARSIWKPPYGGFLFRSEDVAEVGAQSPRPLA